MIESEDKTLSNEELMNRIAQGDGQAFKILVYRHQRRILNLIYRFIGDRIEAEDIAQDVFLRVWRSAKDYEPKAKFTTWVYRIAVNLCLDVRKSPHHRHTFVYPSEDGESGNGNHEHRCLPGGNASPEELLLANEKSRQIFTALRSLPTNQRMAVILSKFDELPYDEIARVLGCSVSAVESLLVRAKRALREKLLFYHQIQVSEPTYISGSSLNLQTSQS